MTLTTVPVTQADRDAAASQIGSMLDGDRLSRLLDGKMDTLSLVRAFARHRIEAERATRLASTQEPAGEAMERARFMARKAFNQWGGEGSFADMIATTMVEFAALRTPASPFPREEELLAALKPFAEAADDLDDAHGDNAYIWEAPAAMAIDAGDLRKARALLERSGR